MLRTEMSRPSGSSPPNSVKVLGLFALALVLGGCVSGGKEPGAAASPAFTGSIPVSSAKPRGVSDGDAVLAAVSASTASGTGVTGIPWANAATGTTGVVSQLVEIAAAGRTCRIFQTSRHSYDGITLYFGEACRTPGSPWRLIEFRPKVGSDALTGPDGTATG